MEDSKLSELYKLSIQQFNEIKNARSNRKRISMETALDITRSKIEDRLRELIATEDGSGMGFYPELLDKDFNTKIYTKKEFNDYRATRNTDEDVCAKNLGSFSLSNAQMLVKNYVSPHTPYNGILLWWGVGIGKTCAAISIAEGFVNENKERLKGRKTLIITSGETLNGQWRRAIFDPLREDKKGDKTLNVQCSGDNYTTDYYSKLRVKRAKGQKVDEKARELLGNSLVNKNYNFYGYEKFANNYEQYERNAIRLKPKTMTDNEAIILMIKDVFSNRVIIIDEAHNTNPQLVKKKDKKFSPCIKKILRYAENTKLVLLSATPINNSPRDIVWLLNLLLLNDKRGTLDKDMIFSKDGNFKNKRMEEYFLQRATGYISYIRSENPLSYPLRISPLRNISSVEGGTMVPLKNSLTYRCYYPYCTSPCTTFKAPIKLDGERNPEMYKYLQLIENPMTDFQYTNYIASLNEDETRRRKRNKVDMAEDEMLAASMGITVNELRKMDKLRSNKIVTYRKSIGDTVGRMGLIMIYPTAKSGEIDDVVGNPALRGFDGCFNVQKGSAKTKYKYKSFCRGFLKRENVETYSKKFATIYDCITTSKGIIFVHIPYKEPAKSFCMMLEEGGYSKWNGKNFLDTGVKSNGVKYLFLTGDTSKKNLNSGIAALNKNTNINGEEIKVVIATDVAKEGLNFFNVREIHITSPWFHLNRLEQIIGRGMRNCSHKNLEPEHRNVTIYYHAATIPSGYCKNSSGKRTKEPNDFGDRRNWTWDNLKDIKKRLTTLLPDNKKVKSMKQADLVDMMRGETFDEYLYWYAVNKAKLIAPIERALKKRAFDCNLNRLANVNTKTKYKKNDMKSSQTVETAQGIVYEQELYDADNSQICDFMECEYTCDNEVSDTGIVQNMDTYNLKYAQNDIESVKTYIKGLFSVGYVYSLEDITSYITDITGERIDELYIYYALDHFVRNRVTVFDKYDRPGYILYVPDDYNNTYYIFQPLELDDTTTTVDIRDKPLVKKDESFKVETPKSKTRKTPVKIKKRVPKSKLFKDQYKKLLSSLKDTDTSFWSFAKNTKGELVRNSNKSKKSRMDILNNLFTDFGDIVEKILYFKIFDSCTSEELLDALRQDVQYIREYLEPIAFTDEEGNTLYPLLDDSGKDVRLYVLERGQLRPAESNEPIVVDAKSTNDKLQIVGDRIVFKAVPGEEEFGFKYEGVKHPRDKKIINLSGYGYNNGGKFFIKETVLKDDKTTDIRFLLKGSVCKSNRDKQKLSSMIRSMSGDDVSPLIYGKFFVDGKLLPGSSDKKIYLNKDKKVIEVKLDKDKCCEIIQYASLYNRIKNDKLYYKFKYEAGDFRIVDLDDV